MLEGIGLRGTVGRDLGLLDLHTFSVIPQFHLLESTMPVYFWHIVFIIFICLLRRFGKFKQEFCSSLDDSLISSISGPIFKEQHVLLVFSCGNTGLFNEGSSDVLKLFDTNLVSYTISWSERN